MTHIKVYEYLRQNKTLSYTPTKAIAKALGYSYHKTYRILRTLEQAGIVQRKSHHSGWRAAPLVTASYKILLRSYRRSHDFISAQTIGVQLNTNDRIIRQEMNKLEQAGIIQRNGSRGGWKPIRTQAQPPAVDKLIDTLRQLYTHSKNGVSTKAIANALNIHPSHARRHLARYHQQGIIQRQGYFAIWQPISA